MITRHTTLLGTMLAFILLLIATARYPGGSQNDAGAAGFDWRHNYLSNLLNPVAVNGTDNAAYPWATGGMLFLCFAVAVFFVRFSKKIPSGSAANVIKYTGTGAMAAAVFTATPWHDAAVTVAGTLLLVSFFYITFYLFKSKMHLLKILATICMVLMYAMNYIYYTRSGLDWLPVMQKASLSLNLSWLLALEYFTERGDFRNGHQVV